MKELRDKLMEEYHWGKYTATYHAIRMEFFKKTGLSKIIDKVYDHYAEPILEETNLQKLNKIKNRGLIEFKMSYPITLCSVVAVFVVDPLFCLGMIPGTYLNWRGEAEYFTAKKKLEPRRVFSDWIRKGNRILKIENMAFVITVYDIFVAGYACDNNRCYALDLLYHEDIGRMIAEKKTPPEIKRCLRPISKENFVNELIKHDSLYGNELPLGEIFAFAVVDLELLPEWVVPEVVAEKLSQ